MRHHLQSFFFVSADALHDLIYLIDLNRFYSSREPRYFYTKRKSFLFFTLSWSQIWSKNILLYMIFWNASRNIDILKVDSKRWSRFFAPTKNRTSVISKRFFVEINNEVARVRVTKFLKSIFTIYESVYVFTKRQTD